MFIKENTNNYTQHEQQQQQNKQITSLSINSLSTSNEPINNNKTQNTIHNSQTKEPSYSYDYSKTRTNTNPHLKHVTFLNPLVQIINVRSYKKYNKLPSPPSSKKNRQSYYDFGQDNIICKCITI